MVLVLLEESPNPYPNPDPVWGSSKKGVTEIISPLGTY